MNFIEILRLENVHLVPQYNCLINNIKGNLHITGNHLIFVSQEHKEEIWILFSLVQSVNFSTVTNIGQRFSMYLKDFQKYQFLIENVNDWNKLKLLIFRMSLEKRQVNDLPCFSTHIENIAESEGWIHSYKRLTASFERMVIPNDKWKTSNINNNYQITESYPSLLVVPRKLSKSVIKEVSENYAKNRFPVLTYYYANKDSALCRSSRLLKNESLQLSKGHISMLKHFAKSVEDKSKALYLIDLCCDGNDFINKIVRKVRINLRQSEGIVHKSLPIENIHIMKSRLSKMLAKTKRVSSAALNSQAIKNWLHNIKTILDVSFYVSKKLQNGNNIIVYGDNGWDRTSQICGLTQIILDPYYRTIKGLEDVIEKDWLSFGFRFTDRCGHLNGINKENQSPVFTIFLDCIYQLYYNYPHQFEYNEILLIHLHKWSQDCVFGTLVGNNEKDRLAFNLNKHTYSIWDYVQLYDWEYLNPLYNPDNHINTIESSLLISKYKFWTTLYCPQIINQRLLISSRHDYSQYFHSLLKSYSTNYQSIMNKSKSLLKTFFKLKVRWNYDSIFTCVEPIFDLKDSPLIIVVDEDNDRNVYSDGTWMAISENASDLKTTDFQYPKHFWILNFENVCNDCSNKASSDDNMCFCCYRNFCKLCLPYSIDIPIYTSTKAFYRICRECSQPIKTYELKNSI